jgi:hypothetical protein
MRIPTEITGTTAEWRRKIEDYAKDPRFAGVRDRDARRDDAIKAGIEAIQDRDYLIEYEKETKFQILLEKAKAGDKEAWREAQDMSRKDRPRLEKIGTGKGDEFNERQRAEISRMRMLPKEKEPEKETGSGAEWAGLRKNLLVKTMNGLDKVEPGKDSLGNQRDPGLYLNDAYSEIEEYAKRTGLDAQTLKIEFDQVFLEALELKLSNEFRNHPAAAIIRNAINISDGLKDLKIPDSEIFRMQNEFNQVALNIMAMYRGDHSAKAEAALEQLLRQAKDNYIADAIATHSLLRDLPGTSQSQYGKSNDLTKPGKAYYRLQTSTAAVTEARHGEGFYTPASIDNSAASVISTAKELLENDFGFDVKNIQVDPENGKTVIAKGKDGETYRIMSTDKGAWYLEKKVRIKQGAKGQTTYKDGWEIVARREYQKKDAHEWYPANPQNPNGGSLFSNPYLGPNR